jgi:hypothetical protein
MISEYALSNWDRYLQVTPKAPLGRLPVAGAYDAKTGDHGFSRRVYVSDFERGGRLDYRGRAFDAAPTLQNGPIEFLRFIASKLSPEDWSELQTRLCSGEDGEEDEGAEDDQPEFKKNRLPKTALEIAGEDMALATGVGRIKGAGGTPVLTSARATTKELAALAGRIVVGA